MLPLFVDDEIQVRLFEPKHTDALTDLILNNRSHLDQWMRWSAKIQTRDDVVQMIDRAKQNYESDSGFHAGLWYRDQLVGGVACRDLDRDSHNTEIGYWLDANFTGKGLITRSCTALLHHLFEVENMHRVEIQCMTTNTTSRAVAERLGFTFEGVRRESLWIANAYQDHAVYSMLDREFSSKNH